MVTAEGGLRYPSEGSRPPVTVESTTTTRYARRYSNARPKVPDTRPLLIHSCIEFVVLRWNTIRRRERADRARAGVAWAARCVEPLRFAQRAVSCPQHAVVVTHDDVSGEFRFA